VAAIASISPNKNTEDLVAIAAVYPYKTKQLKREDLPRFIKRIEKSEDKRKISQ